jgi:trehalose 6-phosphate phosphatase
VSSSDRFAPLLADPAGALIACDYDGTLAPIVADPSLAVLAPGAFDALLALAGRVGQLAVVTGRAAADAVSIGGLDRVPGLVVLGLYGAQSWSAGVLDAPEPPPGLAAAQQAAELLAARVGARVEAKGGSFAVHTRQAPDPAGALDQLRPALAALAAEHGLQVEPGRLVIELRPAPRGATHADKGSALLALARSLPAGRPATSVLYAGDDLGDLPAFEACRVLAATGTPAWSVAAGSPEAPEAARQADLVVDGPAGVVALLTELVQLLG